MYILAQLSLSTVNAKAIIILLTTFLAARRGHHYLITHHPVSVSDMARLLGSLLLLNLILATSAAPQQLKPRSFKIRRQATGTTRVRNGIAEMGKAYQKFGFPVPDDMSLAITQSNVQAPANATEKTAAKQQGSTDAKPQQGDSEFLSLVDIGGQTIMMDFDTGSSDLWVFNTQLSAPENQGHTVFDPSKSKTFKPMQGGSFHVQYGDNSFASGSVGLETVSIGGAHVSNQAIGLPNKVASSLVSDTKSNGLVGLGFKNINTVKPTQQNTFFENVQPSLVQPLFTANLKHSTAGAYEFGNVDQTQFVGKINFAPVDSSNGFWQFTANTVQIGDGTPTKFTHAAPAIADTGTSLLLMDPNIVQAYYNKVEGAQLNNQGVIFPCTSTLPDLNIQLAPNYMGKIPGSLINYQSTGNGMCFGGLQSNAGQQVQILGDVMFKSQFVVFEGTGPNVGFAPHA